MSRPQCPPEENIVRAVHFAHWDEQTSRKSSAIFKGQNLSVSRLAILLLPQLFPIFHQQLDTSPNGVIVGAGEINVGKLQKIGREYQTPVELTVEKDPLPDNPAHAEIPQRISSRGLAKAIINEMIFHRELPA